jgi:transcriptional regulator with XRE-family HTH domain
MRHVLSNKFFFMPEDFPARLKQAREMRGLNQADLAKICGLQPSAISHFETGGRAPSFDNLKRLSNALSVTTDFLMGHSETPSLSGSSADKLFRKIENLSSEDLKMLEGMADLLANKNKPDSP